MWDFRPADLNEFYWRAGKLKDRFQKVIDGGLVEKVEGEKYRLVNWSHYAR